jgi:hypothetical protein
VTPSEAAEVEAKKTFNAFVKWSKVTLYWIIGILLVLASCDFGTDTKTGSQYNGAVYAPSNIGE